MWWWWREKCLCKITADANRRILRRWKKSTAIIWLLLRMKVGLEFTLVMKVLESSAGWHWVDRERKPHRIFLETSYSRCRKFSRWFYSNYNQLHCPTRFLEVLDLGRTSRPVKTRLHVLHPAPQPWTQRLNQLTHFVDVMTCTSLL